MLSLKSKAFVPLAGVRSVQNGSLGPRPWRCRSYGEPVARAIVPAEPFPETVPSHCDPSRHNQASEVDPLYLFACHLAWEKEQDSSAGWDLIAAANSSHGETRAQARALLGDSESLAGMNSSAASDAPCGRKREQVTEADVKSPYGLELVEDCTGCGNTDATFFCGFSQPVLGALNAVSHKSVLPAGAILFVEGQMPRGMFIICSGRVNLSTTSKEGKILILKTAVAGEALGLSAAISGVGYETTAETATPCQLNFIDRKHFLQFMEEHSETGVHAAQCLSRDYQTAYRDIHDLVLTRSSAGKLARLLLSQSRSLETEIEPRVMGMTHEEMAQRIGASRETVTRLLSHLRKKHLIRLDGPSLVIRDRPGLEALTF